MAEPMPTGSRVREQGPKLHEGPPRKLLRFQLVLGKRPRRRNIPCHVKDKTGLRLLPPGTYSDYFMLLQARHPNMKLSLKSFTQIWVESFRDKLAIRPSSQHAKCSICIKHKCVIRKLGKDAGQRACQMRLLAAHLHKQYEDRTVYWANRSKSRLPVLSSGLTSVTIIIDSIDHSKLRYPKAPFLEANKDYAGFQRPHLDLTCALVHGHGVYIFASEPYLPKNANWHIDLVGHLLERLGDKYNLQEAEINLQCDNTSRECKNNSMCRAFSAWTASAKIKRGQISCLLSGHSHEDIDQFFALLSNELQSQLDRIMETPRDILRAIQEWLDRNPQVRPHEKERVVMQVDACREWCSD